MLSRPSRSLAAALTAAALSLIAPHDAQAFCGFYVSGAGAELFNNATMVALMREGTRTVLSMQNNYQGPPESFAMVVPVPVILQKENVKTLPTDVFKRLDELAAPRLVEYWEQDPCYQPPPMQMVPAAPMGMPAPAPAAPAGAGLGVKIEARFSVGEYEVLILSAQDSTGLDTWLRLNKYNIPKGAEAVLRPYVQGGMKFFVAKVDIDKVRFEKGQAMLSPLRFHYDSESFNLPVRLGLLNSGGVQDLLVHVLAPHTRYELANYPNVTIPTNLDVNEQAKAQFGAFYAALFDRTVAQTPRAAVTEYSWDAGSCDPCPTPPLSPTDLATLGADVLHAPSPRPGPIVPASPPAPVSPPFAQPPPGARPAPPPPPMPPMPPMPPFFGGGSFVLTRIHIRYGKETLGEDLVFKAAPPLEGGREHDMGPDGKLDKGGRRGGINNFQARYAIRHPWKGPITCDNPRRGVWGGPPPDVKEVASGPMAASNIAFAPRGGVQLASMIAEPVPQLSLTPAPAADNAPPEAAKKGGCAGCDVGARGGLSGLTALAATAVAAALARRRKRL